MFLRNPIESKNGIEPENIIEYVEKRSGRIVASCTVNEEVYNELFPDCPFHIRLDIEGDRGCIDGLMGAALARARSICAEKNTHARIYVPCAMDDEEMLDILAAYGFRNDDGIDRMYANLPLGNEPKAPMGAVVLHDKLEDAQEQRYFIDRYNSICGTGHDHKWLNDIISRRGFRRILSVAPTGMVGEIIVWFDGECGVIEFFDTAKRWREMGVAQYMLKLACQYIHNSGCKSAAADVRAAVPAAKHVLAKSGFDIVERIVHYPFIEV